MKNEGQTGSRIRERRIDLGLRQGDLALKVGISPAYLNLIEHNKRRIGGKLLVSLAATLAVEPIALTQGGAAAVVAGLKNAASNAPQIDVEEANVDQFLSRFPGWAALIEQQSDQLTEMERRVALMSDRLAHDPVLSESLHEVLTAVTSIRSTASILAQTPDIDRDWQRRFQTNVFEDSARLADTAQSLVSYFETMATENHEGAGTGATVEAFFAKNNYHFPELENDTEPQNLQTQEDFPSGAGVEIVQKRLKDYKADATDMPLAKVQNAIASHGFNPAAIAQYLQQPLGRVLVRLSNLPNSESYPDVGLIRCDLSGSIILRKPIEGFALPLTGAACPLWPMYQALAQPGLPLAQIVETPSGAKFQCYAVAEVAPTPLFNAPLVVTSTMIMMKIDDDFAEATPIGPTCQICPRSDCRARRNSTSV